MENKNRCDICDSDNTEIKKEKGVLKIPFGPDAVYDKIFSSCEKCGTELDITEDIDIVEALNLAERQSIKEMVEYINNQGYSKNAIERIFELGTGTINRWIAGLEHSSAGVALFRLLRTYPWLIEVAEQGYDENNAEVIFKCQTKFKAMKKAPWYLTETLCELCSLRLKGCPYQYDSEECQLNRKHVAEE